MTRDDPQPLRHALAGALAMAAAMGIGRFVLTPILPAMMDGLGMSASDAGLVASANYVGYLAGALLAAGGWAEGRERLLTLSALAANAVLLLAMALANALETLLVIRFLAGVASAFVMVFLASIVFGRLVAAGRGDLQAVHFSGVGLGMAFSAALVGFLFVEGGDWRTGWLASGLVAVAGFPAVALLLRGGLRQAAGARREPPLPRSPELTRIILAYGLFGAGYVVTATFLVAIVRGGGSDPQSEALVWVVTGLAAAPSVWLWGKVARRIGLLATFAAGSVVEAAGVVASVALPGLAGPLLGAALLGGTVIAVTAVGLQAGRVLAGNAPRRSLALMTASFGVGQILGPIAAGYAADWTGSFAAPSFGAAVTLLAAAAVAYWPAGRARG